MRVPSEGTSQFDPVSRPSVSQEASSSAFSYDNDAPILKNLERLASIWGKLRARVCELPSLEQMLEHEAYVQMAVVNSKVSCFSIASGFLSKWLVILLLFLGYGGG